jgi:carbon storage regulator CsrA
MTGGWLLLKRYPGEDIIIDTPDGLVTVRMIATQGRLRVAVKAPKEIPVHRREVFEQIHPGRLDELPAA